MVRVDCRMNNIIYIYSLYKEKKNNIIYQKALLRVFSVSWVDHLMCEFHIELYNFDIIII